MTLSELHPPGGDDIISHYNTANDKTWNPVIWYGIPGGIYSHFNVIATSSCTSRVGVCCHLLNLSMDNSTVLGFPDTNDKKDIINCYLNKMKKNFIR